MNLATEISVLLALGLATSFVSGLFGIGGGIVRIPVFIYLLPVLGVKHETLMHTAVGTSVALVIPTAIAASIKQQRQGNLDLGYYRTWAVGIACGVILGTVIVPYVPTEVFKIIFIVFLLTVAVYVGFVRDSAVVVSSPPTGIPKIIMATLIGLAALLTGTGGGALTTPSLRACSMPLKKAVAIASATGLVVGGIGTIGFIISGWNTPSRPEMSLGYVDLPIFFAMLPTIFIGAPLGAKVNNRIDDQLLKRVYAVFLLAVAADLIYKLVV